MKKIILLLSITALMLQSCSSESDNNSKLFGRWYIVSDISNGTNITHTICSNNGNRDYCDFISPNIANFYFIDSSADDICSDEFALSPSTFTKNGNTLKFYNNGVLTATYTITELTTTSLKISTTYTGGSRFTEFSSI